MPQKELDLHQFTSVYVAQLRTGPPKIVRSEVIKLNPLRQLRTTYQTTFSEIPRPHEVPCRTALNTLPSATVAAAIHLSTVLLTQIGIGTVRTWLPLPTRSTMARFPC